MEAATNQAFNSLNVKIDDLLRHIENIERKVDKIHDEQTEQYRTVGILESDIKHSKDERRELKADHKNDIDLIWKEFRRKEKMIWSVVLLCGGFVSKIIYEWVGK